MKDENADQGEDTNQGQRDVITALQATVASLRSLVKVLFGLSLIKIIVIVGLVFAVSGNGNNIGSLTRTATRLETSVTDAKQAATDARAESRAARQDLNEAIALVQNSDNPGFSERVEAGLRRIEEVNARLERIEALLADDAG